MGRNNSQRRLTSEEERPFTPPEEERTSVGVDRAGPSAENTWGLATIQNTPVILLACFPVLGSYDDSLVKHFQNVDWL